MEGQLPIKGAFCKHPGGLLFQEVVFLPNYQRFCQVGLKLRKPREHSDYLDKFKIFISFYHEKNKDKKASDHFRFTCSRYIHKLRNGQVGIFLS